MRTVRCSEIFGAYADLSKRLRYTDNSKCWLDLSLISSHGRQEADRLKLLNPQTYQELIFSGLGLHFTGEPYLLPEPIETELSGDVAVAANAGPIWPMKKWAYYDELKRRLEDQGLTVNVLPKRPSLREHLADVRNHRCLVSGDSCRCIWLGTGMRCVSPFTCASPWEIYDHGIQQKIDSPRLEEFFYSRDYDIRATTAITVDEVGRAALHQLQLSQTVAKTVRRDCGWPEARGMNDQALRSNAQI